MGCTIKLPVDPQTGNMFKINIDYATDDELLEVTPHNPRIHKRLLDTHMRGRDAAGTSAKEAVGA